MKKEVETKGIIIKELQDIKERYKALYDRSFYFVYVHDFEGKFIDANKAALDLLGYSKEEIPSISFSSLLDKDQLPTAVKALGDILKYGHQKKTDYLQTPNQEWRLYLGGDRSLDHLQGRTALCDSGNCEGYH
ncbi:hypothetical protein ES703_30598 [subsurface metagenome]|nr:PAS domain S-box protein [bacterium]